MLRNQQMCVKVICSHFKSNKAELCNWELYRGEDKGKDKGKTLGSTVLQEEREKACRKS